MRVGFLQFSPLFGEKQMNCEKVRQMIAGVSADLIVLPELFSTGYFFSDRDELMHLSENTEGATCQFMKALAQEKNCLLSFGFAENLNGQAYNSMALVSAKGVIGIYRKIHLFREEKNLFAPGTEGFQPIEYQGIKYGLIVCFDWIYPEAIRTLALKGAQIILHGANLVLPYCPDAMVTRAIENRVFIITADRIGKEKKGDQELTFIGRSRVVSPKGEILVKAGEEECVRIVGINPAEALDKKITPFNDLFRDRRAEFYFK